MGPFHVTKEAHSWPWGGGPPSPPPPRSPVSYSLLFLDLYVCWGPYPGSLVTWLGPPSFSFTPLFIPTQVYGTAHKLFIDPRLFWDLLRHIYLTLISRPLICYLTHLSPRATTDWFLSSPHPPNFSLSISLRDPTFGGPYPYYLTSPPTPPNPHPLVGFDPHPPFGSFILFSYIPFNFFQKFPQM